ncbi:hypothetical protein DJ93_5500 [Bacillus clarus]|uniref:Uncharacterized protein n=1 Tax=Bacillus clarus TaxID=2338372 RepID=A0A090YBU5_9BACI|nr:hypothetical protein DJ93_5500 [Bacillus clarus]
MKVFLSLFYLYNEEINWEKVNKQSFEEFGASMNIRCTILSD